MKKQMLCHVGKVSSVYSLTSDSGDASLEKKKKNHLKFHHPESRPDKMHILFRNRRWLEFGRDHNLKEASAPTI